jgi:hypothetical protein
MALASQQTSAANSIDRKIRKPRDMAVALDSSSLGTKGEHIGPRGATGILPGSRTIHVFGS